MRDFTMRDKQAKVGCKSCGDTMTDVHLSYYKTRYHGGKFVLSVYCETCHVAHSTVIEYADIKAV